VVAELLSVVALLAPGERSVTCAEVIGQTRFPHVGIADPRYRPRTVLATFSAPGVLVPQSSPTGPLAWPHFSKWGMVVRGGVGDPVTVTVPRAWRNRLAISWGNGGHGVFHTIRFPRCGPDASIGNAWAGGFFLKQVPQCVPLRFAAGGRTATRWFGITRRCR
jgi:hypothetical protein